MNRYLLLCILFISAFSLQAEIKLPVRPETHEKLSLSLRRLLDELQLFRTPYENKTNLYKRVALTEQYLQEVNDQVSQHNNVVIGQQNKIDGQKNVIVGSYNTISGSNNFVFIEKFTGQANGDLLIGKWRIQIEKKRLILVNASFAVSFINQEENRKYLRFLTQNRAFGFGSSQSPNSYTIIKQVEQQSLGGYAYGSSSSFEYSPTVNTNYRSSISKSSPQQAQTTFQAPTSQSSQASLGASSFNVQSSNSAQQSNQGGYVNPFFHRAFSSDPVASNTEKKPQHMGIQSGKPLQDSLGTRSFSQYSPEKTDSTNNNVSPNSGSRFNSGFQSNQANTINRAEYSASRTPTITANTHMGSSNRGDSQRGVLGIEVQQQTSNLRSQGTNNQPSQNIRNSLSPRYVREGSDSPFFAVNGANGNQFFSSFSSSPSLNSFSSSNAGSFSNQAFKNVLNLSRFRSFS